MTGILLLASCAQTHENAEQVDHLPNMYPDYADVTIPVNIAPLHFANQKIVFLIDYFQFQIPVIDQDIAADGQVIDKIPV